MGILHSKLDIRVTQDFLQSENIATLPNEVAGKGVSAYMCKLPTW